MNARETRPTLLLIVPTILACAALAGGLAAAAASRRAADPNELYERSVQSLERGDLTGAAASATKLRDLVHARPEWDPEGSFGKTLLPPLLGKIRRLQAATAALDAFSERALAELKPPDLQSEISTVKDYTRWATSIVERLRSERTALVAASLSSPEEVAILHRTPGWARSERLFEVDVLQQMADKTGDDILGLLSGDPKLESVLVRFRQLKRDLMQVIAERDDLQARLKEADTRRQALLEALAAAAIDEDLQVDSGRDEKGAPPAARFLRALAMERDRLRRQDPVTAEERDALETTMDRLRLSNRVLTVAGIVPDQKEAIASLARLVAALPARDARAPAPSSGRSWLPWILVAGLGGCAGAFARLALDRGRRLAVVETRLSRFDSTLPNARGTDAGRRAA
jgi:hypothetical protein